MITKMITAVSLVLALSSSVYADSTDMGCLQSCIKQGNTYSGCHMQCTVKDEDPFRSSNARQPDPGCIVDCRRTSTDPNYCDQKCS